MASKCSYEKLSNESSDFMFDYSPAFEYSSLTKNIGAHNADEYKSAFTYNYPLSSVKEDITDCDKESWPSVILRHVILCVSYCLALLIFPVSVFLCVKRVHSLERLVVSRLGKLQPIKGPGFVVVLPIVDHWTTVDLHPKQLTVSTPQILTVDGGIVEVTAEVNYQVSDILHYVTKSSNPFKSVQDLSLCCLVNIVTGKGQEELEKNREIISETLKVELNKTVVKWGVEITTVSLKPMKILKAAEPVSAISTIMSALKAVAEQSSFNSVYAGITNQTSERSSPMPAEMLKSSESEHTEENSHIVSVLRHFATSAANKETAKGISAIFKLEIVCADPKTAYIIIHDGNINVVESIEPEQNPDVSVVVTESLLQDILNGKISALEAYLESKITISGNWALLNTLSELLN